MFSPAKLLRLRSGAEKHAAHLHGLIAKAEKAAQDVMHGMHGQRRSGAGESFWQFRPYEPGDRPQDIDWRQSAKGDHVFIRQRERQLAHTAYLWCSSSESMDFSSAPDNLPSKGERAQLIALATAILMMRSGEYVQMAGQPRSGRGEPTLRRIAYDLVEGTSHSLPDIHEKLTRRCFPILIGDFLSPIEEIEPCLKSYAAMTGKGALVQILDPAEISLPYEGRAIFEAPGQKSDIPPISNIADVREAYISRINAHMKLLESLCRSLGMVYIPHLTSQEPKTALNRLYQALHFDEYGGRSRR